MATIALERLEKRYPRGAHAVRGIDLVHLNRGQRSSEVAGLLVVFMRRVRLPGEGLYPLRSLAAAGVIYGLAAVAHGSGFLAVFIAGLALSEIDVPHKRQIQRFHTTLASLAEIVVFVALGLTVSVGQLTDEGIWRDGLLLAIALAFLARPLGLAPLLWPLRLKIGEKLFLAWGGLKGAVPILLASFVILLLASAVRAQV